MTTFMKWVRLGNFEVLMGYFIHESDNVEKSTSLIPCPANSLNRFYGVNDLRLKFVSSGIPRPQTHDFEDTRL